MNVYRVVPFGYCQGVVLAMSKALQYASTHQGEEIYLLGMLVHNEDAVASLYALGVHVLDERESPLIEHLRNIPDRATVIFSAHGHPRVFEEIAKQKGLKIIDTTCVYVDENKIEALNRYEYSSDLIYIGSKGHLEAEAVLEDLPEASFYNVKDRSLDIRGLLEAPLLFAQTTLGKEELEQAIIDIVARYPAAKLVKGRCQATTQRQDSLLKVLQTHPIDALIVLGSSTSNNSKKLAEIGEQQGVPSFLCLNLEEVKKLDLSSYSNIALSSGASTSRETFLEVESYLSSF